MKNTTINTPTDAGMDNLMKTITRLLLSLCAVSLAGSLSASGSDTRWPQPGFTEAHEAMALGKASLLADRAVIDKIFAQTSGRMIQENYDVRIYDIDIRVNDTTETLYGHVRFVARATQAGTSEIIFDLHDSLTVDSIVNASGLLSFVHENNYVTVSLDRPYDVDEQFEFTVYYFGHPVEPSAWIGGFAFHQREVGPGDDRYVISSLSQPYGARTWWPCKDRNDDKADSFLVAITVDSRFWVASNGRLDSTVFKLGHARTFYYVEPHPLVTELFMIAVSDYFVYEDDWVYNNYQDTMPIVNAVYPEKYDQAQQSFAVVPTALTIWSNRFGLYPFADVKYGHVNFEWPGGALEHQTMTSITDSWYGWSEYVVIHELAHQWYGDFVSCKSWADIWISEGWATYSEAIYYEARFGSDYYHDYMDSMYWFTDGMLYRADTTDPYEIFDGISYYKGAWVVHMLRGILGDSLFFQALTDYYNSEFAYGSLDTWDLCHVFEQSTGTELDWYFQQWVFGWYRPNYRYSYWVESSDSGGYDLFLALEQTQTTDPQVFVMPIDFTFKNVSGQIDTLTLWMDQRETQYNFNFPDSIVKVQLDPRHWIMKYVTEANWRLKFITLNDLPTVRQYLPCSVELETRGGTGSNVFSITAGELPDSLTLDTTTGEISGVPVDSGLFTFSVYVDDIYSNYWDEAEFNLYVEPTPRIPGDIDVSGEVEISDLIYLVDYSFTGGPPPPLPNLADVDGSCAIDIADLVYLVDYMFNDGPAPVMGCVE